MHNIQKVIEGIYWVGGSDRRLSLFENLFPVEQGVSYNSYVIIDNKTALLDTVDSAISDPFMENVEEALNGRTLDYLIINHMEPDHCANISNIVLKYPNVKIVGNAKTFQFMEQFYSFNKKDNYLIVKENDILDLGKHKLRFFMAPFVHWPEVMFTYDETDKVLFSADAFGTFGAHNGNLFADELNYEHEYLDQARRYYANIVGKYGNNVQSVFKKLLEYPIKLICPLHGPIFRNDSIKYILDKYQKWSMYEPEVKSVLLIYASMYGNTGEVVDKLATNLSVRGVKNMKIHDVSKSDVSYIISDMWKYSHIVIDAPNYNAELYYKMDNLIREAMALNIKNRKFSIISNATWGGNALKTMLGYVANIKDSFLVGEQFEIKSSMKDADIEKLNKLADAISGSVLG